MRRRRPWLERLEQRLTLTLPPGFEQSLLADGLTNPTSMVFAPDGRLFVTEQAGAVRVVQNGTLLPTPFLTLGVDTAGERGLQGLAFDPDFVNNQYVYAYYTTSTAPIHNRLSRFTAQGNQVVPGSEVALLDLENLGATIHNGGALRFGVDGTLFVSTGDNAVSSNAQTLNNRLGKILRINPDGSIPSDNPFYNTATGPNRAIWALGLRNPFTMDVRPGTGRLFINDVGQNSWEEINEGVAGANYGWPATEGPTDNPAYRGPLFAYQNSEGGGDTVGCAITGGAFYDPPTAQFPSGYAGTYFFQDFCNGWIRTYRPSDGAVAPFQTGVPDFKVDLDVGPDGDLFYLSRGEEFGSGVGAVYRISYTGTQSPSIITQPSDQLVSVGGTATFTVRANGVEPLSYQWQRDGVAIAGATSPTLTLTSVAMADSGAAFRAVVSNGFGSVTSASAILTVTTDQAPTATITAPASGARYGAGDTISFAGAGTDPEDGTLPPGALTWRVDFRHETHFHPFIPAFSGASGGSFVVPRTGETAIDVAYRIILTVEDSAGLTNTTTREVLPRTSTMTFTTSPAGLQVTLDGQPMTTPAAVGGVVGMTRTLSVVSPQTLGGVTYEFASWSDGGAATHDITTPDADTTYTATFRAAAQSTIVDDGDPGYSQQGTWFAAAGGYQGDHRLRGANGGSTATYQVAGLAAGGYEVQATWPAWAQGAPNTPYRIYDGDTLLATVRVDQRAAPSGPVVGGATFQVLATVPLGAGGTLRVVVGTDASSGHALADAVRIAPASGGSSSAGLLGHALGAPDAMPGGRRPAQPGRGDRSGVGPWIVAAPTAIVPQSPAGRRRIRMKSGR